MATALVVGNMIGSGVFLLPSALASYGGISIVAWLLTTAGAVLLAPGLRPARPGLPPGRRAVSLQPQGVRRLRRLPDGLAAARDRLFPAVFAKTGSGGAPVFGLVVSSVLVTVLLAINYTKSLVEQFTFIILLAGILIYVWMRWRATRAPADAEPLTVEALLPPISDKSPVTR
jgi:hypothetical protein